MRLAILSPVLMLAACAASSTALESAQAVQAEAASPFVGSWNGSSFETAMFLRLSEDRTFEWALTVGGLDMTAQGNWQAEGDTVTFASDPVPVPTTIALIGVNDNPGGPMLRVFHENGKPVEHSSTLTRCADGQTFLGRVGPEGSSPNPEQCPDPVSVRVMIPGIEADWPVFDLAENGWQPGKTIRFEFKPGDYGVMDFTGMAARLEGDVLTFTEQSGGDTYRRMKPPE